MQFFAILCLPTYDWFCADGSHITQYLGCLENILFNINFLTVKYRAHARKIDPSHYTKSLTLQKITQT